MSDQAKAILDLISQDELVSLAGDLIKIPSFVPDETPVAEFLEPYFQARGYDVVRQEVNPGRFQVIATLRGSGGGKTLMFNGHTDINSLTAAGDRDPWQPTVEGDRLYGHGVQNMKSGLSSMIIAAEAIRRSGLPRKGDLVLACVVGETQGGEGSKFLAESGLKADMAILPEPMGVDTIFTTHAGIMHFAVHTHGVTGHISQKPRTVNAVEKMTKVIQALSTMTFTQTQDPKLPDLPLINVGSVIGGRGTKYVLTEPPYVPDICTAIVDVHFNKSMSQESILADVRAALDPVAAADPDLKYEIEIPPPPFFRGSRRLVMDPVDLPVDAEVVKVLAKNHEAVTGAPPKNIGPLVPLSYSAGDACWLAKAGIPAVYYGPAGGFGDTGGGGSYTYVSEMLTCAKVLAVTGYEIIT